MSHSKEELYTLDDFVKPMVDPRFNDVIKIAHWLIDHPEVDDYTKLRRCMVRLLGYLAFASTVAGWTTAERRRKYAETFLKATGTAGEREAQAELACSEERHREEVMSGLFKSIAEIINGLKKIYEIRQMEWEQTKSKV